MTDKNLDYVLKVIKSCKTEEQVNVAHLWAMDLGFNYMEIQDRIVQNAVDTQKEYLDRLSKIKPDSPTYFESGIVIFPPARTISPH